MTSSMSAYSSSWSNTNRTNNEPKLQPNSIEKLLPPIEAYVAKDKFTQALLFIKKFKDFRQGSSDF